MVAEAASILSGCSSAKLPSLFSPLLVSSSLTAAVMAVAVAWNVQVKSRAWGLNRVDVGCRGIIDLIYMIYHLKDIKC